MREADKEVGRGTARGDFCNMEFGEGVRFERVERERRNERRKGRED